MVASITHRAWVRGLSLLLLCLGSWPHLAAASGSAPASGDTAKPATSDTWSAAGVTSHVGPVLTEVKDGFLTFPVGAPSGDGVSGKSGDMEALTSSGGGMESMTAGGSGPTSVTRTYIYDAAERLCKVINPESGATIIEYDAAGNIVWTAQGTSLTGPNCDREHVTGPMIVVRRYDEMNRVKGIISPGAVADSTTTYTPDGLVESMTVANMWNGGSLVVTNYVYNKRRLLESETSSQPGWYDLSIVYGYNANGHLSSVAYPYGLVVPYAPNALGQPTQAGSFASGISYFPNGAIKQFTYGNGIVHTMTPNGRGLPARSQDMNGATPVLDDSYAFDANGNVSDIIDQAQGTARGMAYDPLDRLITAVSTGTPSAPMWGTANYTYDALDNLRTSSLGLAGYTYNYDANNRLATLDRSGGSTYTYQTDQYGNVSNDGRQTYQWDTTNRLLAVADKEYYRYDGLGRRVLSWRPTGAGQVTLFVYSQAGQVLHVEDGLHDQRTSNVYLGNTLLATRSHSYTTGAEVIRYQHTDALGSPVATTDANRAVVERTVYAPYGAPVNRPVEGVGYTGHVMDQTTGLTYMQQRYYDPQIGRFLSVDPAASEFNRYSYASNNPYTYFDPDGRQTAKTHADDTPEERAAALAERQRRESEGRIGSGGMGGAYYPVAPSSEKPQETANRVAQQVSTGGGFSPTINGVDQANAIYAYNSNPDLAVTVDASRLAVSQSSPWRYDNKMKAVVAKGRVNGPAFLVHGHVTLRRRPDGSVGIYNQRYHFDMHQGGGVGTFARNAATVIGTPSAGPGNTPFWINYVGNAKVE